MAPGRPCQSPRLRRRRLHRRRPEARVRRRVHLAHRPLRRRLRTEIPPRHRDGPAPHRPPAGRSRPPRRRRCALTRLHGQRQRPGPLRAAYAAFAPDLAVIAPWREWDIRSREDAIAYAAARNIPVAATATKIYSRDRNIWHVSHEGGILEDPNQAPPADVFQLTVSPQPPRQAGNGHHRLRQRRPRRRERRLPRRGHALRTLNTIGARHGVGRVDLVEDRLVGMKSRGIYDARRHAALTAHSELEQLTLDRRTLATRISSPAATRTSCTRVTGGPPSAPPTTRWSRSRSNTSPAPSR